MTTSPRFLPSGDGALVVEFGDAIDRAISARVLALANTLSDLSGLIGTVPTFRSLLVRYDPLVTSATAVEAFVRERLDRPVGERGAGTAWRLPACYEGTDFAPDIDDVARRAGISPDEIARLHTTTVFHVYLVGFTPGFAYMGDLPEVLAFPRRADPRVKVPAGSVAIAQGMTGVYPYESPGGWHLIANCPLRFFDPAQARPSLLAPGDTVRFEPIDPAEHARIRKAVDAGDYRPVSDGTA